MTQQPAAHPSSPAPVPPAPDVPGNVAPPQGAFVALPRPAASASGASDLAPPAYGQPGYPPSGSGAAGYGPSVAGVPGYAPPPASGWWQPERIEPVPGTQFGLVHLRVVPITSGLAIGSLIAGIATIVVSFLVFCFGVAGSESGWGGWVSGAFALLSVVAGGAAIGVGIVAQRQIRESGRPGQVRFTGRGVAIAGIVCGSVGAGIALLSLALALVLQSSS